ncbi:hypothetical protein G7Y89_g434 [Cudoniella acicularis]|uniref:Uncharacterized protein n=1 Tax=Cudoniella acicularis TaxID=354080 RepID=A0A8H4RZX4_9HELO|nr:hypothetical protein G7Y89_g434 [Cudoniella acicularis]
MPRPPIPLKTKKAISFAPSPDKSRNGLRNSTKTSSGSFSNFPPSATQAFLENNLDDFFPSPSQEVRELADYFPSNTQITKELGLSKPSQSDRFEDIYSTQDLMSSQDILEITTPSRVPQEQGKENPAARPRALQKSDIEKTHTTPAPAPRNKTRFFQEKEDILHAAPHESKSLAALEEAAQPTKPVVKTTRSTLQRAHSIATDYGDDEFTFSSQELLALEV